MSTTDKVKLPEPFTWYKTHNFRSGVDYTYTHNSTHAEDWARLGSPLSTLYTSAQMLAMHEQGRLAGLEEGAEACDDVEEPRYYGYENPNTFSDGKAACISAIRSLAAASIGAKMGGRSDDGLLQRNRPIRGSRLWSPCSLWLSGRLCSLRTSYRVGGTLTG